MMARPAKGDTPRIWNKLRCSLKRAQLRQARKEAERQRKQGGQGKAKAQEEAAG